MVALEIFNLIVPLLYNYQGYGALPVDTDLEAIEVTVYSVAAQMAGCLAFFRKLENSTFNLGET